MNRAGQSQLTFAPPDPSRQNPYIVQTDPDIVKMNCALCQEFECCPEHCCDWDTNQTCQKNKARQARPQSAVRRKFNYEKWENEYVETDEPEVFIKASGDENVQKFQPKKKILLSKKDQEKHDQEMAEKTKLDKAPKEVITTEENLQITNFEVGFGEEEELTYAGGIKGIRALRVQRDLITQQISQPTAEGPHDKFAKYTK